MELSSSPRRCSLEVWDISAQQWLIIRTFDSLEEAALSIRNNWQYDLACLTWDCGRLYQLSRPGYTDDLRHIRVRLLIG